MSQSSYKVGNSGKTLVSVGKEERQEVRKEEIRFEDRVLTC